MIIPEFYPERIPTELAPFPQWVTAGADKIPHIPSSGLRASPTNRADWGTFEEATAAARQRGHRLGFVLTDADPFVLIDLDKCRSAETGDIEPWARAILASFPTAYAEVSASGCGLHIVGTTTRTLPAGRKTGKIEVYTDRRYMLMTGDVLPGHERLGDITEAALKFHAETFPPATPRPPQRGREASPTGTFLEDDALIERARSARNGAKFNQLWSGDTSGHGGDDSAADLALVSMLAFWTSDPDQIDRVFRRSGLYRDKWERGDYSSRTIARAMERSATYTAPTRITATSATAAPSDAPTDGLAETDTCRLELANLRRELAAVQQERDDARNALSMVIQTALNPNLSANEKTALIATNGIVQHKRDTGQIEPDGKVICSAAETSDDWRKAPPPRRAGCPAQPDRPPTPDVPRPGEIDPRDNDGTGDH